MIDKTGAPSVLIAGIHIWRCSVSLLAIVVAVWNQTDDELNLVLVVLKHASDVSWVTDILLPPLDMTEVNMDAIIWIFKPWCLKI